MTKKEAYIDRLSKQLKEWAARIDDLETKAAGTSADIRSTYDSTLGTLKAKREALSARLLELKDSSGGAWSAVAKGVEAAKKDLKKAVTAARNSFKKAA